MRRALVFLAIGAALLAAAVVSGHVWGSRDVPEWLRIRVEARMSEEIGAPVSMQRMRLGFRGGVRLLIGPAEVGPTAEGHRVFADRVTAWLDPIALFGGHIHSDRLIAESARVEVKLPARPTGNPLQVGLDALHALRTGPVRHLEIESAELWLLVADSEPRLLLEQIQATSTRQRLREVGEMSAVAAVARSGGRLLLSTQSAPERTAVELQAESLEFARVPTELLGPFDLRELRGRVTGSLSWEQSGDGPQLVTLAASGRGISGRLFSTGAGTSRGFRLDRPRAQAQLRVTERSVELHSARFSDGDIPVRFSGKAGLPWNDAATIEAELRIDSLELTEASELIERLAPPADDDAAALLRRVGSGRIEALNARISSTRAGLREIFTRDLLARPRDITVEAALADAQLDLGGGERLEALGGKLVFDGDQVSLSRFGGNFVRPAGESTTTIPLPWLNATLRGLSNLRSLDELRCHRPAAPGYGLGAPQLIRWLGSHPKKPRPPGWHALRVEADWVSHPLLLCGIEQLEATVGPIKRGVGFDLDRMVWAGVELSGSGEVVARPREEGGRIERVSLELELGSPFEAMALVPPREPWAQGRFRWDATRLGNWRILGADGRFRLSGDWLHIEPGSLDLSPSGSLDAAVAVRVEAGSPLDFRIDLHGEELDAAALATTLRARDPGRIAGVLEGDLHVEGALVDGRTPLATGTGSLVLNGRDGSIHHRMPVLFALIMAEAPLQTESDLKRLAVDDFRLEARFEDAALVVSEIEMTGPSARIVSAGRLGLERPFLLDSVLGILLFPRIDSTLGKVPLVNRLILSRNKNLVGAYYTVKGPIGHPDARLIPSKSVGPARVVLDDVPSYISGGLERIQSILVPTTPPVPPAAPEPQTDERGNS